MVWSVAFGCVRMDEKRQMVPHIRRIPQTSYSKLYIHRGTFHEDRVSGFQDMVIAPLIQSISIRGR